MTTTNKLNHMTLLSDENHIISALAIDQRGALKKIIAKFKGSDATDEEIISFKKIISSELTPYASSILLDPEYGIPATKVRAENAGLLVAYEETGYDATTPGRLPDLLPIWSVKRLKEIGSNACKFLLYYDIDESDEINDQKQAFVERIGSECMAEELPFFLELLSYDATDSDNSTREYAQKKPHKVNEMTRLFSEPRFNVNVLKVEVPVNMKFVEGFSDEEAVYTQEEAARLFKEQAEMTNLPFIFLSAGVSAEMFQDTLTFAKNAGSTFNGVLCGRATWANGVEIFVKDGEDAARHWMRTIGRANIESLNEVLQKTATPIKF